MNLLIRLLWNFCGLIVSLQEKVKSLVHDSWFGIEIDGQ